MYSTTEMVHKDSKNNSHFSHVEGAGSWYRVLESMDRIEQLNKVW